LNPDSRPQDGEDGQERAPGGGALLADACVKSIGLRRCYRAYRSRPGPGFDDGLEYVMTLPAALPLAPYRPRLTRSLGVHELARPPRR
jgi:hypothetical protein